MTVLLLDVAPYPVFPPTRGGAIAIHQANLAVAASMRVHLVSQGLRKGEWRRAFSGGFSWQHAPAYREDRVFSMASLAVGYACGQRGGGSMLSADRTLSLAGPQLIRQAIEGADIIQVEHPWQVPTLEKWNHGRRPLVLVAHNAEADVAAQLGRPAREVDAIRAREAEALAASDAVIVFTEDDRSRLGKSPGANEKRFQVIPLGVDTGRLRPASRDEKEQAKSSLGLSEKRVILFVGSLYGPNVEAAAQVFRMAEQLNRADVVFVIAGRVGERFRTNDRVLVTHEVDEMGRYLAAADIAVNPMQSGGGMQVKLLEFLAAGLPTITTAVGARGVAVVSGRDALLSEVNRFTEAVDALLNDQSGAAKIAEAGRELVRSRYTWDVVAAARIDLYRSLTT